MISSTLKFHSLEALTEFIAAQMQDHKDIEQYYPGATIQEITEIFDMKNAITLNPEIFPYGPVVNDGDATAFAYAIERSHVPAMLERVWDYECYEVPQAS